MQPLPDSFTPLPKIIFSDVDDTLTHDGQLPAETFTALYNLKNAGFTVVPVTGGCAGWCDCLIKIFPVDHIIGENGALTMFKDSKGIVSTEFTKKPGQVEADLITLKKMGADLAKLYPAIGFTQDQAYRLTDVAFDIGQNVTVPQSEAQAATDWFNSHDNVQARFSSIHINVWIGEHSKATAALNWLKTRNLEPSDCVFIGDSPNDESMFQHFPLSVGVANVKRFTSNMDYLPVYVTDRKGGYGFADMANTLLQNV